MASFDTPGAYIHTETNEEVIMVPEGSLSEFMMKLDPKIYRKYVTINSRGKSILYVKMHKSLYGFLRSALIFYKKLSHKLEVYGLVINP